MAMRFRDIRGRRAFAVTMLSLSLLMAVALGAIAAWQHALAEEVAALNRNPDASLSGPMTAWVICLFFVVLGHLVIFIATAVAFLMWMHRATANALALGRSVKITPGWSVGWWFIPFANLVMPARSMLDVARASEPEDEERESLGLEPPSRTLLVGTWWAAWLGMNTLSAVAGGGYNATTPDEVRSGATFGMVSYGLALLAGTLAIVIIVGVSRRQLEIARDLARRARAAHDEYGH